MATEAAGAVELGVPQSSAAVSSVSCIREIWLCRRSRSESYSRRQAMRWRIGIPREGVGWVRVAGPASDERVVGMVVVVDEAGTAVPAKCCSRAPGQVHVLWSKSEFSLDNKILSWNILTSTGNKTVMFDVLSDFSSTSGRNRPSSKRYYQIFKMLKLKQVILFLKA